MKKRGAILFFFVIMFSTSVSAVGLSHPVFDLTFEPNLKESWVFKTTFSERAIELEVGGNLAPYVTIDKTYIPARSTNTEFTVTLELPESLYPPGEWVFTIGAHETLNEEEKAQGMFALIADATVPFTMDVPYEGQYIETYLSVSNLNIGEKKNFSVQIKNKGKQRVDDAHAVIDIKKRTTGEIIKTLQTIHAPVKGVSNKRFYAEIDGGDFTAGSYEAVTKTYWDKNMSEKSAHFKVGSMDIILINYTGIIFKNEINPINITIKSGWNSPITDVRVKIFIGTAVIETPSISLKPWEEKTIAGYFDARGLKEGEHPGTLNLFFGDEEKTQDITMFITKPPKKQPDLMTYAIVGAVILIILLITFVVLKKKKKKNIAKIEPPKNEEILT